MGRRLKQSWQLYLIFLLPLVYVLLFKYVPFYGLQLAFKDFIATKGIGGSDWVGFKHFDRFFHSYEFGRLIGNTVLLGLYQLIAEIPVPILLALALNYVRNRRFGRLVQMVSYAPHFISVVVVIGMIFIVLDPQSGILQSLLKALGQEPVNMMGQPEWFKSVFVWSGVWQHSGFACIVYLAALSSIDPSLHEAAVVDGATKLQRMKHIDLPGILPIAIIMLILNAGNMLDIGFEKVLLLQNPLNLRTSEVIDTYVYKVGLASQAVNYSYSTAIHLFKSAVSLLFLVTLNQTAKKMRQASLW